MANIRILLVDDEEELVTTMAERLELRGFAAEAVTDGAEALVKVRENTYDIAVVDVKMPGVSGLAVLKSVKTEHPELPVILLTGHGDAQEARDGTKSGAAAYLFKPVDIEELIKTVQAVLGKGGPG